MAPTTAASKTFNISIFRLAITSSTRYLLDQGKTNPDTRLTTIKNNPTKRRFFRGQIMVLNTWANVTLGFTAVGAGIVDNDSR
jgi:hypothetical protein